MGCVILLIFGNYPWWYYVSMKIMVSKCVEGSCSCYDNMNIEDTVILGLPESTVR